jgi:hypothetical protein
VLLQKLQQLQTSKDVKKKKNAPLTATTICCHFPCFYNKQETEGSLAYRTKVVAILSYPIPDFSKLSNPILTPAIEYIALWQPKGSLGLLQQVSHMLLPCCPPNRESTELNPIPLCCRTQILLNLMLSGMLSKPKLLDFKTLRL